MLKIKYIDNRLTKNFANDNDPLNKVRSEFLVFALIFSFIVLIATLPSFYFAKQWLLFYRSVAVAVGQVILLTMLLKSNRWKIVAHGGCLILAVLIWTNMFVPL